MDGNERERTGMHGKGVTRMVHDTKAFSSGAFVSVTSGPSRGKMGWVERIVDDTASLLQYKEIGNVSSSSTTNRPQTISPTYESRFQTLLLSTLPFIQRQNGTI